MLQAFVLTDVGKMRSVNQDAIYSSTEPVGPLPNLFIVADGMGGHNGGEIASQSAVTYFCDYIKASKKVSAEGALDLMTSAAHSANKSVLSQAELSPKLVGMGTTLTACTIFGNKCNIVHIGDSRAYVVTPSTITQITHDHSYVNEMVKAGQITENEAKDHPKRNILTRALGIAPDITVDGHIYELESGSVILLCSDGLFNMVSEESIKDLINSEQEPTAALVTAANDSGGADNISVIIVKINEVIP